MATDDTVLRTVLVIAAVLVLLPILMMPLMVPMMGTVGWSHMGDMGMWGGAGWIWLLMWLVVLAVAAGLGYLLYRGIRHEDGRREDAALEELRVAYAKGELSDEEFESRRERLRRDE